MKKFFLVNIIFYLLFQQSASAQTLTTAAGMRYQILKDVPGTPAKLGDVVKFHIIIQNSAGEELQNSYTMSAEPQVDLVKKSEFGWSYEEIFTLLSPGDSAMVLVSSDSVFSEKFNQQRPPSIQEHSDIKFIFKLFKIQTMAEFDEEVKAKTLAFEKEEDNALQAFIKSNKLTATKTASGLYYAQKKKGSGPKAKAGDKVKVHYTGRLIDSTKFDSSVDRGEPFEFELGGHQVIAGWDEGIALMSKGEKGILLIPSRLGYGERGAGGSIGPNSILVFDVELVDFTPAPVDNSAKPAQKQPDAKQSTGTKTQTKQKATTPSSKPKTVKKTELK